jgi:hypothetical protein
MQNTGLILERHLGMLAGAGTDLPDILPSGDWEPYLPDFERQAKLGLETMNCVQFSRLNVCETLARFHGKPLNLSDRFLYWASGCTAQGNTYSACDFGLRQHGCPDEGVWPWTVQLTRDEYGQKPPQDVQDEAARLQAAWDVGMLHNVTLTLEGLRAALKKGPLWFCNETHSMMIYRIDDRIRVFDTYPGNTGDGKGSFPLDYLPQIYAAYNAPFTPKTNAAPMIKLPNNSLVIVVDDGERLMNIDGSKLYRDDAGKILLEVTARNSKDGVSSPFPIIHVHAADVANIPRVNLKGEPV